MTRHLIAPLLAAMLVSCAQAGPPPVAADGRQIRVTDNPDVVRECEWVANVKGSSGWGGTTGQGVGHDDAMARISQQAAELGADTVYITTSEVGTSGVRVLGEAYACRQ